MDHSKRIQAKSSERLVMGHELNVHYCNIPVGRIDCDELGRISFHYDRSWLVSEKAFPISISMPLSDHVYGEVAHFWFANLLPEQRQRTLISRRLKISEANDFGLLRALGGECAGALTINDGEPITSSHNPRKKVSDEEIMQWIENPNLMPIVDQSLAIRLSLAGAQDKIPVIVENGDIYLPAGGLPSTHILKLPSQNFTQIPENEYFVTALARSFGINAHLVQLRKIGKKYVSLAKRYDRLIGSDGKVQRLHQEDFCQAMGYSSFKKYEDEGGPTLSKCINLAAEHSLQPLKSIEQLIKWTIFNVLVGNCDAHAKNLSFVWDSKGGLTLAPFYDLVSTLIYESLARKMALHVGGESNPYNIAEKYWMNLASEIDVKYSVVRNELLNACDQMPSLFENEIRIMGDQGFSFSKSIELKKVIIKQSKRFKSSIQ